MEEVPNKYILGLPGGPAVKNLSANAGDAGSIPGSGRSPGVGMATHSSILAWKISHGQRKLAGYSPWGRKELDVTKEIKHAAILNAEPKFI